MAEAKVKPPVYWFDKPGTYSVTTDGRLKITLRLTRYVKDGPVGLTGSVIWRTPDKKLHTMTVRHCCAMQKEIDGSYWHLSDNGNELCLMKLSDANEKDPLLKWNEYTFRPKRKGFYIASGAFIPVDKL